eukprot:747664-Hanusia_phi.AAC.1
MGRGVGWRVIPGSANLEISSERKDAIAHRLEPYELLYNILLGTLGRSPGVTGTFAGISHGYLASRRL